MKSEDKQRFLVQTVSHWIWKMTTVNDLTLPMEKFLSIPYANYLVRCFHRCELTDSISAAIPKDKKVCVNVCACWGDVAQ